MLLTNGMLGLTKILYITVGRHAHNHVKQVLAVKKSSFLLKDYCTKSITRAEVSSSTNLGASHHGIYCIVAPDESNQTAGYYTNTYTFVVYDT